MRLFSGDDVIHLFVRVWRLKIFLCFSHIVLLLVSHISFAISLWVLGSVVLFILHSA